MKKNVRNKYRSDLNGDHNFDYKDAGSLMKYIGDAGKITPSRISKLSIAMQKRVAAAVKKARNIALIPNGTDAYDTTNRSETISPTPFEF